MFEQGARPGWFVAADGDRVVGAISCRDGDAGLALISEPMLRDDYRGRTLEVWMIERAALYAETNGYHTAELPAAPSLDRVRKELEDRLWYLDGTRYVRAFRTPPVPVRGRGLGLGVEARTASCASNVPVGSVAARSVGGSLRLTTVRFSA
ncbi:MAG: hypothetical protein M5U18_09415 [Dehalococcoidia bacterium]|nr:hypothetical protein [Dehalococcoidia bacterium]